MRLSIKVLLFFICLNTTYAQFNITEIMFNPTDGNEWVEVYYSGSEPYGIQELYLADNYATDKLICCSFMQPCVEFIIPESYFLIFDQDTTYTLEEGQQALCVDNNAIGNGLGNNGDLVSLLHGEQLLSYVEYTSPVGKGNTLSRIGGIWKETLPSPWRENEAYSESNREFSLEIILPREIYAGRNYSLFRVSSAQIRTISLYYNISQITEEGLFLETEDTLFLKIEEAKSMASLELNNPGRYIICGVASEGDQWLESFCSEFLVISREEVCPSLKIKADQIYKKGDKIEFSFFLAEKPDDFEITYWIEDLFGNIIKEKLSTKNTNKKSFTPSFEGEEKSYIIKAHLSACPSKIEELLVSVRGNPSFYENSISIEKLPNASFGDTLQVSLKIVKGDTKKTDVKVYLEGGASYVSKINVGGKNIEYSLSIPVQLKPNCDRKYKEGLHTLVAEGIDKRAEAQLMINGFANFFCREAEGQEKQELYSISSFEQSASTLQVSLNIFNNEDSLRGYKVWSYIYNGSVSYSGEMDENMEIFSLEGQSNLSVTLQNSLEGIPAGEYKLKIKIQPDDRKNPYEITRNITISLSEEPHEEIISENILGERIEPTISEETTINDDSEKSTTKGKAVYTSPTRKIKENSLYFVVLAIGFSGAALFLLRLRE